MGLGVALKRAFVKGSELSVCSIRVLLFADGLADLLQFEPDCGHGIAAGPGMLAPEVPFLAAPPGDRNSTLPLEKLDHRSYRVLWGDAMHM